MKFFSSFFSRATLAKLTFSLWLSLIFFCAPQITFAALIKEDPDIGCRISINSVDALSFGCLAQMIVNAVQWAYGFSLLAGMGYFIFGGITFMMAADEKGIKAGRDKMIWAVLGFVFIVVSFLIVRVILLLLGIPDLLNNFSLFVPSP